MAKQKKKNNNNNNKCKVLYLHAEDMLPRPIRIFFLNNNKKLLNLSAQD